MRKNKVNHPPTVVVKPCTVRLDRISDDDMKRLLNTKFITHNVTVKGNRNSIRIADTTISSKNHAFNIELKVSESGITVVSEGSALPRNDGLDCKNVFVKERLVTSNQPKPNEFKVASNRKTAIATLNYNSIPAAWEACKREHVKNKIVINVNDICMAKVRGHQPWPAIVLDFVKKKHCKVEFFGANKNEKFGLISINELTLFKNSGMVVRLVLKKNVQKYRKAVQEAEIICNIPSYLSSLNGLS